MPNALRSIADDRRNASGYLGEIPYKRDRLDPVPRRGFYKLRLGLPEKDAPEDDVFFNFALLPSRVGRTGALLFIYIAASARQGNARVELLEAADYLDVDERTARLAFAVLLDCGLIRATGEAWVFSVHPGILDGMERLPQRTPKKYQRKPMHTACRATRESAAFQPAPTVEPEPPPAPATEFSLGLAFGVAAAHRMLGESETGFTSGETPCRENAVTCP